MAAGLLRFQSIPEAQDKLNSVQLILGLHLHIQLPFTYHGRRKQLLGVAPEQEGGGKTGSTIRKTTSISQKVPLSDFFFLFQNSKLPEPNSC